LQYKRGILLLLIAGLLPMSAWAQAEFPERPYERWGLFGVGKLRTMVSTTNNVGDGQLRWPEWAHLPAMEYPYNSVNDGTHVYYAVAFAFHVGGYSTDYGPTYDESMSEWKLSEPRLESADRAYYRFYDGWHYDGMAGYVGDENDNGVPLSDDPTTWPSTWPSTYPTNDIYHSETFPNYQNAYARGLATARPLELDSTGFPGIGADGTVLADQEFVSFAQSRNREYVIDEDRYEGKLMIYTVLRGLSYSGDFYDDMMILQFEATNIGTAPITDTYYGIKVDWDYPWASYASTSSYSKCDAFAYDDEYKMAYGWDGDGDVAGATFGNWDHPIQARLTDDTPVTPALSGTMFLKTPKGDDGLETGVATFDAFYLKSKNTVYGIGSMIPYFYHNNVRNREVYKSDATSNYDPDDNNHDGIDDWTWENPFPTGPYQAVYSSGYKCEYTMNAGPFTLDPGETDTLIVAVVMGDSRNALFKNARYAQQLYRDGWIPLRPPLEPELRAEVGSGYVKLIWDARSESDSLNAVNNRKSFEGYKLYRSIDNGQSWGNAPITDENGTVTDYVPLGQWDLANGLAGGSNVLPTFQLGEDTGLDEIMEIAETDTVILELDEDGDTLFYGEFAAGDTTGRRFYIDDSVIDGLTYRYCVAAYSAGDDVTEEPPVQSSRSSGTQIIDVTPHAPVARTSSELDLVKVVPNPYRVTADWEYSTVERKLKFTHVPTSCSIRIFNVAGEHIVTLEHNETASIDSEVEWNLRSKENREVAPGLYFFHLESPLGETTGKFVIIL